MATPIETVIEQVRKLAEAQAAFGRAMNVSIDVAKASMNLDHVCTSLDGALILSILTALARENEELRQQLDAERARREKYEAALKEAKVIAYSRFPTLSSFIDAGLSALTPPGPSEGSEKPVADEWARCPVLCETGWLPATGVTSRHPCRTCNNTNVSHPQRPGWVRVKPAPSAGKLEDQTCRCTFNDGEVDRSFCPVHPIHGTAAAKGGE